MKNSFCFILFLSFCYAISSCKKEDDFLNDSSVKLSFSEDTIIFDTVFTTIGSTTGYLLVYNNEGKPIKISSIRLANGASSNYRINVDGSPGKSFTDIEIGANDSIWIFVEVTVDPNSQNTPFLITDSILFETNGNLQDVDLVAYGQNAHFITPTTNLGTIQYSIIPCNGNVAVWDSTLPWVIYGYAVVDSACKLIIEAGTKIYFYQNSGLWVYRYGVLKVNGNLEHPVTFQGTRLEQAYADIPGQWDRIWINEGDNSDSNEINYAIIKNGFIGLQPEDLPPVIGENNRTLVVKNTIIKNMSGFGILARDYTINGYNMVVANCGLYATALTIGGTYDFNQCTFANYWSEGQRSTPAVYINNYYTDATGDVPVALNKADFKNCIVYGNIKNELQADILPGIGNYKFSYCLLKVDTSVHVSDLTHFENVFTNTDPGFEDASENNYELTSTAFAKDKGNDLFIILNVTEKDIKGINRMISLPPDLGAYEKQ